MPRFIELFKKQKAIAAIDLGSNALRAIIAREDKEKLEVIRNFRKPLRLGEDVFHSGKISAEKMKLTEEAFISLFHIFAEYNVTEVSAKATSAMRDSKNGPELARRIAHSTGIELETIGGLEEAEIIFKAVKGQLNLQKKTAVIMDIGGGSTEIIVIKNREIIGIHSFNIGTVRLLQYKDQDQLEDTISENIREIMRFIREHLGKKKPDLLIGTGGNLRRIGKIRKKILGRPTSTVAQFNEIHHMEESILSMSYVERIRRLELDQNRADVILPAIMLTHHLMQKLKMKEIQLPKVGLKEGILLSMLDYTPKTLVLKD